MKRFFLRIFASVWIVMMLTVALTLFAATWLRSGPADAGDSAAVSDAAREVEELLEAELEPDVTARVGAVLERHQTDADGDLRLFLIDAGGGDVLGRDLPLPVSRWLRLGNAALMNDLDWASRDARLIVHASAVAGQYRLVGYRGDLRPIVRVLERRGGRLILLLTALAASIGASFVVARSIVLPLRRLRDASQQAVDGDLGVRLAPIAGGRSDDIAGLARNFDAMTEQAERTMGGRGAEAD